MAIENKNSKSKTADSSKSLPVDVQSIKNGLKANVKKITDLLKNRVGAGDWSLWGTDFKLDKGKETVDLIFHAPDDKKGTYVLIDLSVPHLQVGQKYELPAKAKLFQKEQKIALTRIKKAIVLVRKGTETIAARPSRIRCPILELQLEQLLPKPQEKKPAPQPSQRNSQAPNAPREEKTAKKSPFSDELLFALKEAIVHECLSTMHKRQNKYIRKGLWRWIEREIMDPNVHFYLIILSSIYQGKTGETLSRKFKTVESFSENPEAVINMLFSKETNLAEEIRRSGDRHKKALKKFLACFSQTPPFEYLKSIFLKEFRTTGDGLKARMAVFSTLHQLLERCGFEGEKEVQYPLEILDELKIFQGIMTGNYIGLRIENAGKKLKHLLPQVEWTENEIYQLRNQIAKALNLPSLEFNLNAFLPQAFFHDAKHLAESRKEAVRNVDKRREPIREQAREQVREQTRENRPLREKEAPQNSRNNRDEPRRPQQERPNSQKPAEQAPAPVPGNQANEAPISTREIQNRDRRRFNDTDEAFHRNFENFGGHIEEDTDAIRLAIAMDRYEQERAYREKNKIKVVKEDWELMEDAAPPLKISKPQIAANTEMPKKKPLRRTNSSNFNRKSTANGSPSKPGNGTSTPSGAPGRARTGSNDKRRRSPKSPNYRRPRNPNGNPGNSERQ